MRFGRVWDFVCLKLVFERLRRCFWMVFLWFRFFGGWWEEAWFGIVLRWFFDSFGMVLDGVGIIFVDLFWMAFRWSRPSGDYGDSDDDSHPRRPGDSD